jgi:hypothetical protein
MSSSIGLIQWYFRRAPFARPSRIQSGHCHGRAGKGRQEKDEVCALIYNQSLTLLYNTTPYRLSGALYLNCVQLCREYHAQAMAVDPPK